jgi:hypothetical protein
VRFAMAELAQPLFACQHQLPPDSGAPVPGMDVDGVELAVTLFVVRGPDRHESHHFAVHLGHDGRMPAVHGLAPLDGESCQLILWQGVCVCDLPGLDLDTRDRFGILRCALANHCPEPTPLPINGPATVGPSFYGDFLLNVTEG